MKVKVSEATGVALDWMVAKCWYADRRVESTEGKTGVRVLRDPTYDGSAYSHWFIFFASTNPEQAYPIIEREGIATFRDWGRFIITGVRSRFGGVEWGQKPGTIWGAVRGEYYMADPSGNSPTGDNYMQGDTPLIAAMRCYVASKLGDEVEVPDELV